MKSLFFFNSGFLESSINSRERSDIFVSDEIPNYGTVTGVVRDSFIEFRGNFLNFRESPTRNGGEIVMFNVIS